MRNVEVKTGVRSLSSECSRAYNWNQELGILKPASGNQ